MEAPKPQIRRKTIMLSVAGVVILLAVAWLASAALLPEPSIKFVEFRGEGRDAVAIFRVTNKSWVPYSFYGYDSYSPLPPNSGPPLPFGAYRAQTHGGSKTDQISPCRVAVKCYTIAGRSTIDVQMTMNRVPRNAPVALGIRFQRGTDAHISSTAYRKFVEWNYRVRNYLNLSLPDYTWSNDSSVP